MNQDFTSALRPAIVMTLLFTLLLGLAYPLAITGIGQTLFAHQARGSLIERDGRVIGSEIVGQAFVGDRYFQTRPSAAGSGYDGMASAGSNLGPASRALSDRVAKDVAVRRAQGIVGPLPADLVTASGSGLDPDLSPDAALVQVPRIARVRGIAQARIRTLVEAAVERPLLGEPHVDVFALNRALDASGRP